MANNNTKEIVAKKIAEKLKDGDVIGVGSGTTVAIALGIIGQRVQTEKLRLSVVPTSIESAWQCQQAGLTVLHPGYHGELSWGFDGADAVDSNLWLIKGKGGALFQEKVVAARCKEFIVIVDQTKICADLAKACSIPVEVLPQARFLVEKNLKKLGASSWAVREGSGKCGPVITEQGNIIIDVTVTSVSSNLELELKSIVGVVESGLFVGYATEVWVGKQEQVEILKPKLGK